MEFGLVLDSINAILTSTFYPPNRRNPNIFFVISEDVKEIYYQFFKNNKVSIDLIVQKTNEKDINRIIRIFEAMDIPYIK